MRAPNDLDKSGRALWAAVTKSYVLEPHHELALASACRAADMITRLESLLTDSLTVIGSAGQERLSPAVAELRQHRLALSKLLVDLALPADVADPAGTAPAPSLASATSRKASKAANARWSRERRLTSVASGDD